MTSLSRAEELLQSLGITKPSEIDLEAIAWDQGVEIRYRKLDGCEARIIGTSEKAIISINPEENGRRQRFSIGHELGHWCHHRGRFSICLKEDIGNNSTQKISNDPERVADRYAADLLLPLYIFKSIANQYNKPTFDTIISVSNLFKVSLTATAIRYAIYGSFPCVLVCHNRDGRRWFIRHPDVPERLFPNNELSPESKSFEVVFGDEEKTRNIIRGDAWFNWDCAARYDVHEETIKIPQKEQALILLTWKNKDMKGMKEGATIS